MAFCPKCGTQAGDDVKFCPNCGAPINDAAQQAAPQAPSGEAMFPEAEVSGGKVIAVLMYLFPILFFLPLVMDPKTSYLKFHANQALILLIAGFVSTAINVIPVLGQIVFFVLGIGVFVFMIMGIISAVKGTAKPLPYIDKIQIIK